jgi:hypothetical protein
MTQNQARLQYLSDVLRDTVAEISAIISTPQALKGVIGNNFKVTASTDDGNVAANVLDSDFNTRWSAKGAGEALTLELPAVYEVDSVQIAVHEGDKRKQKFNVVYPGENGAAITIGSFETSGKTKGFESFSFPKIETKHLRILGHMNSENEWNSFTGVRVNDPDAVKIAVPAPKPEPAPTPKPDPVPTPTTPTGNIDPKVTRIWRADLQNVPLTGIDKNEQLKRAFHGTGHSSKVGDWWFDKENGRTILKTRIKKGLFGSDTTGINAWADAHTDAKNPAQGYRELFFSYSFIPRGPKKWAGGSKLPGPVVGGFGNEGPFNSGGDNNPLGGGSARTMMKGDGWIYPYLYSHDPKGKWGTDMGAGRISQAVFDELNRIDMRVVMNNGSNADGILQIWHQEKLVCTLTNITWQLEGNVAKGWNKLSIGSFNGGSGDAFKIEEEAFVDFTEFEVGYGENPTKIYSATDRIKVFGKILGGK